MRRNGTGGAASRRGSTHPAIMSLPGTLVRATNAATGRAPGAATAPSNPAGDAIAAPAKAGKEGDGPPGVLSLAPRACGGRIRLGVGAEQVELAFTLRTMVFVERHVGHLGFCLAGITLETGLSERRHLGGTWPARRRRSILPISQDYICCGGEVKAGDPRNSLRRLASPFAAPPQQWRLPSSSGPGSPPPASRRPRV